MGFSDHPWPEDTQLFPKHAEVQKYIEDYSQDIRHLIQFETQVIDLHQKDQNPSSGWILKTQPITRANNTSNIQTHHFDAVVIANGHFNIPYIPFVPGIEAWTAAHPGTITHSKFYRQPEHHAGRKVIIVGNSASGLDIAAQIAPYSKPPLLISSKSDSYLQPPGATMPSNQHPKPPISKYLPDDETRTRTVEFEDGTTESGIDAIIYCTGYFYSFPFMTQSNPTNHPPHAPPLTTTGERVENTYVHLFHTPNPTLALPTLNQKIIPFPHAEAQAAVLARVFSGRLTLPSRAEMEAWEEAEIERKGDGRGFHVLAFPEDGEYVNMMYWWAVGVDGGGGGEGEGKGKVEKVGKTPPFWGEREFWIRERFPAIKRAFQGLGEGRHGVRSLGEVGFDFEIWKKEEEEREEKEKGKGREGS